MIWPAKETKSKHVTVEGKVKRIGALSHSEFTIAYAVVFEGQKSVQFYVPRELERYIACSSVGDNLKLELRPSIFGNTDWDLVGASNEILGSCDSFQNSFLKP